ncbi:MAG: hypothetical protein KC505_07330 [Myxococcales bacterium]|nr:hypothetical protein [Myxococcales bacterium]USN50450.1 MAG: hypothetical protein H6731_09340 [Myxococcales bacterium]
MKEILLSIIIFASFARNAESLIVHEWGTFTSFMGSDGVRLSGMHHEEEKLPTFVYGFHNPQAGPLLQTSLRYCGKVPCEFLESISHSLSASDVMPKNPIGVGVTQKMETPVIYFYGKEGQHVKVDIDFPQGIISQYYPKAHTYSPSYDSATTLGPSRFSFNVKLLAKNLVEDLARTSANSIWNPSRKVKSNTIESEGEKEKFIFYRGVGDFDAKIVVKNRRGALYIKNNTQSLIKSAFILNFDGQSGVIKAIGAIGDEEKIVSIADSSTRLLFAAYVQQAKSMIEAALIKDGLFSDEARALVNTWERSYFATPGIRVLYVLPRSQSDEIIPLCITPTPSSVVRSMVGRIEVMTTDEEEDGLKLIASLDSFNPKKMFGHFYEPKLRRLLALAQQRNEASSVKKIKNLLP